MKITICERIAAATLAALVLTSSAYAATTEEQCRSAKNGSAGKYYSCLAGAEKKLATSGDTAKYDAAVIKCGEKLSDAFQKAEQKAMDAGGACAPSGDASSIGDTVADQAACLADALTGDASCFACGNGLLETGEDCDFGTLGGATCSSALGVAAMGTLSCDAGCVFDTSACDPCDVSVGGSCWFLSPVGQSCSDVCAANGLIVDPATTTYAGSGGTNAQCGDVLTALGVPVSPIFNDTVEAVGCSVTGSARVRFTTTTTADAKDMYFARACACEAY